MSLGIALDPLAVKFKMLLVGYQSVQIHFPDLHSRFFVEGRVVQADMDPGLERFVKVAHLVGCEEKNTTCGCPSQPISLERMCWATRDVDCVWQSNGTPKSLSRLKHC